MHLPSSFLLLLAFATLAVSADDSGYGSGDMGDDGYVDPSPAGALASSDAITPATYGEIPAPAGADADSYNLPLPTTPSDTCTDLPTSLSVDDSSVSFGLSASVSFPVDASDYTAIPSSADTCTDSQLTASAAYTDASGNVYSVPPAGDYGQIPSASSFPVDASDYTAIPSSVDTCTDSQLTASADYTDDSSNVYSVPPVGDYGQIPSASSFPVDASDYTAIPSSADTCTDDQLTASIDYTDDSGNVYSVPPTVNYGANSIPTPTASFSTDFPVDATDDQLNPSSIPAYTVPDDSTYGEVTAVQPYPEAPYASGTTRPHRRHHRHYCESEDESDWESEEDYWTCDEDEGEERYARRPSGFPSPSNFPRPPITGDIAIPQFPIVPQATIPQASYPVDSSTESAPVSAPQPSYPVDSDTDTAPAPSAAAIPSPQNYGNPAPITDTTSPTDSSSEPGYGSPDGY